MKIRPTMQLSDHPDIFAAGDIISYNEQKQLAKVGGHAATIVANILSLVEGKEPKKAYSGMFEGIFITNGKVRTHVPLVNEQVLTSLVSCRTLELALLAPSGSPCLVIRLFQWSKEGAFSYHSSGKQWVFRPDHTSVFIRLLLSIFQSL